MTSDSKHNAQSVRGIQAGESADFREAGAKGKVAGRRIVSALLTSLWVINALALLGIAAWIMADGRFSDAVRALQADAQAWLGRGTTTGRPSSQLATRLLLFKVISVLAAGSACGIFAGLFIGAHKHRRVRSWLAFTVLVAAWLTLFVSWRELAWRGQIFRLNNLTHGFEPIAADLRSDWPAEDGRRDVLGPFMAYPQGTPKTLLLLTTANVPQTSASFSAVELSQAGSLRFQLTGNESGAWLEWHSAASLPQTFVGGLSTNYRLDRFAPLGEGWYLVHYRDTL